MTISSALLLAVASLASSLPAQAEVLLPVWVFADQDTPVAGATVEVVADGSSLRQIDGRAEEATNEEGVVGLEFDVLPAAFTVKVSGGSADGRRVRGVLRTDVEDFQSGTIVYVNPATSLVAELRDRDPDSSVRAATRRAKRILGIPRWHDLGSDLQRSDRWFGGDAFLKQARRVGGIGRLVDRLATRPAGCCRYRDDDEPEGVAQVAGGIPQIAVPEFIQSAALGLLEDLAGAVQDEIKGRILGTIMGLLGLPEDLFDSAEIKEIRGRFDRIDNALFDIKQSLISLEASIERANFNVLVQSAANDVAAIDKAYRDLAWLARMSPTDPTRRNYGATLRDFIRANLPAVPDRLLGKLGTNPGDNVLTAASRTVKARVRFFGPVESAQVQAIYAYYADAQSRLGLALMALYQAEPQTYSPATIRNEIGRITTAVQNQARDYLKPSVPDSVFIDTRTNLMWSRTLVTRANGLSFRQVTWAAPFGGFTLPTLEEISELTLETRNPDRRPENPAAWLQRNARTPPGLEGRVWGSNSLGEVRYEPPFLCKKGYGVPCSASTRRQVRWFNLSNGKIEQLCDQAVRCPFLSNDGPRLSQENALVIFKRPLGAGESYWFQ